MALRVHRTDFNGTPCLRLFGADGGSALVALHGAQVLSWIPADGRERLFLAERVLAQRVLAERAVFAPGAAIRGGIPVVFPQFAGRGPLAKHGFARTLPWRFVGADERATFELTQSAATDAWPHAFSARLHVALGASTLAVTLDVVNTGTEAFAFTAALHTYLSVDDVAAAALRGLAGCSYEDSADAGAIRRQRDDALRFDGEVDRIYPAPLQVLALRDGGGHCLGIAQHGFADTIVWNPGDALAATIGDLAPGEHRRFVCVEAGQVLQPVRLAPGDRWSGTQRLDAAPPIAPP
jgi:glucose-6-phosphate 1-epimerase